GRRDDDRLDAGQRTYEELPALDVRDRLAVGRDADEAALVVGPERTVGRNLEAAQGRIEVRRCQRARDEKRDQRGERGDSNQRHRQAERRSRRGGRLWNCRRTRRIVGSTGLDVFERKTRFPDVAYPAAGGGAGG